MIRWDLEQKELLLAPDCNDREFNVTKFVWDEKNNSADERKCKAILEEFPKKFGGYSEEHRLKDGMSLNELLDKLEVEEKGELQQEIADKGDNPSFWLGDKLENAYRKGNPVVKVIVNKMAYRSMLNKQGKDGKQWGEVQWEDCKDVHENYGRQYVPGATLE